MKSESLPITSASAPACSCSKFANAASSGKPELRRTAWWSWQDSNQPPSDYGDDIADTWGIGIAPHVFPELNVQLLASIPNGTWIEDMGLSADLFVEPVPVVNGTITALERPGHGLAFKPEILHDCSVQR